MSASDFTQQFNASGSELTKPIVNPGFELRNLIVSIFGFVVNILAFCIVLKTDQVTKGRKVLLLSMIVSDGLCTIMLFIHGTGKFETRTSEGEVCVPYLVLIVTNISNSGMTCSMLSLVSALAVYKPFRFASLVSCKYTSIGVVVSWVANGVLAFWGIGYQLPSGLPCSVAVAFSDAGLMNFSIICFSYIISVFVFNTATVIKLKPRLRSFTGAINLPDRMRSSRSRRQQKTITVASSEMARENPDLGRCPSGTIKRNKVQPLDSPVDCHELLTLPSSSDWKGVKGQIGDFECNSPVRQDDLTSKALPTSQYNTKLSTYHLSSAASSTENKMQSLSTEIHRRELLLLPSVGRNDSKFHLSILPKHYHNPSQIKATSKGKREGSTNQCFLSTESTLVTGSNGHEYLPVQTISKGIKNHKLSNSTNTDAAPISPSINPATHSILPIHPSPPLQGNTKRLTSPLSTSFKFGRKSTQYYVRSSGVGVQKYDSLTSVESKITRFGPASVPEKTNASESNAKSSFDKPSTSYSRVAIVDSKREERNEQRHNSSSSSSQTGILLARRNNVCKTLILLTSYTCITLLPVPILLMCIFTGAINNPVALDSPIGLFVSSCLFIKVCTNPFIYVFKFVDWTKVTCRVLNRPLWCR